MSNISKGMNYTPLPRKVGGQESKIQTVGDYSAAKFLGIGKAIKGGVGLIKGFADKDLKGQGFKARMGNSLKTGANALLGTDVFETQDMAAAAAPGEAAEGVGDLTTAVADLSEKVEKNSYDISTLGSGAGSGLTYKASVYGKDAEVFNSKTHPLKKTGCAKKY